MPQLRIADKAPINSTRRALLAGSLASLFTACASPNKTLTANKRAEIVAQLAAIQARVGGRLGVYALDTHLGSYIGFNEQDRFALCSTFKLLLAAAVLDKADAGTLNLDSAIAFGQKDMLSHAPITALRLAESGNVDASMKVVDLCAAAVETSDNPAANLLLTLIGGPSGLTQFLRSIGDTVTRVDRMELELNSNLANDHRDTTTPYAMIHTMEKLLAAKVLSEQSRTYLTTWMINCQTGVQRIRAGLPTTWKVGDKTGSGNRGAANDIAIAWPPLRAPILIAVYMSDSSLPSTTLDEAHREIGKLISQAL